MTSTGNEQGGEQTDNYAAFRTDDGNVVVYDRTNPRAWVSSDYAVRVGPKHGD
ncbi:MAG: hypothetical protein ABEH35_07645 [Haloarculaceae archaeon]